MKTVYVHPIKLNIQQQLLVAGAGLSGCNAVKPVIPPNVVAPWARMEVSQCLSTPETLVYACLAGIDGVIAVVALVQLFRLYMFSRHNSWTRQKVFHCLIGAANLGYTVYFLLNPQAACGDWPCWPHACGFVLIAVPQIVFLGTFLLLLSFWVDLCHQATDREEEEEDDDDDEDQTYTALPPSSPVARSQHAEKHRRCCPWFKKLRVRGRQKFVIAAVMLMCAITATFALLIWYGMGDNGVDSATLAEVYSYFYAVVILLSGGGLAAYGLSLYHKMCKLRSGKQQSADITKVAGLAVVSVVCFTLRALLVFISDIPVINIWHVRQENKNIAALSTFLYYCVGESIPAIVMLWVMRDMPPGSRASSLNVRANIFGSHTTREKGLVQPIEAPQGFLARWMVPAVDTETGRVLAFQPNSSSPSREVDRVSPEARR
ncbi:hypothetical protein R1flu_001381 [Riccia fluitans]|uniref:THH1/TOM1/TOM3 domain-containing protein n=1 Tax=Riccia fluitans TaxID=41844 RepID=A0ABD1Y348_9MARC